MSLTEIFNKEDFNKMIFNPFKVKGSLKKKYPKMKMFSSFQSADDQMITYVLYMYDQNTPMKEQFPDLKIRKEQAAVLSGYNLVKDNELGAYIHNDFFQPMDTLRDKNYLERLWNQSKAPWKVW